MIQIGGMAKESSAALDSIDVLTTTRKLFTRSDGSSTHLPKLMLEATILSRDQCAKLCGKHADHHEHCKLHVEAANSPAKIARAMLASI